MEATSKTVDEAFLTLKSNLEFTDSLNELFDQKFRGITSAIKNIYPNAVTQLVGSQQQKIKVNPLPDQKVDLDILVILGEFTGWAQEGVTPEKAMEMVKGIVNKSDRYSQMNPIQDDPTITIEHAGEIDVELIAAYTDNIGHDINGNRHQPIGRAFWVPKNGKWELADYNHEADLISTMDLLTNQQLIPLIKMLKAIKRLHFPTMKSFQLTNLGYHIIPGIIEDFKKNAVPFSYPIAITAFFDRAAKLESFPKKLHTSNSQELDLDPESTIEYRRRMSELREYCIGAINQSEDEQHKYWKQLFGRPYPHD